MKFPNFFAEWKIPGEDNLSMKTRKPSQERMRHIAWDTGRMFPIPLSSDHLSLLMVNPRLGHVHWKVREESLKEMLPGREDRFSGVPIVVRIYDVTDIVFDGSNAHSFLDLDVSALTGNHYFKVGTPARNYLAEIGLRGRNGSFAAVARSNTIFFDRDVPSRNYQVAGLFVGGPQNRIFSVENIFDAPVYERMNSQLQEVRREEALSIAVVFLGNADDALGLFIKDCSLKIARLGGDVRLFTRPAEWSGHGIKELVPEEMKSLARQICEDIIAAYRQRPFHLIHCHDWHSGMAGIEAYYGLHVPLILSLHSTEQERMQGKEMGSASSAICEIEKRCVRAASLVIVPHSSTREQTIDIYGVSPKNVVIIPDIVPEKPVGGTAGSLDVKKWQGLPREAPLVLFAGEISHAAGADLLIDAIPTVCRNHHMVHFLFAGDGPLKGELEARARHAGIGHRCRFLGDVSREVFDSLLDASDFVVIPARTWRDEGLAQTAIDRGRPVLTTHQSGSIVCLTARTG